MGGRRYWTLCWPGLPPLWLHGAAWGLALAVLFSLVLNLALIVTFVWIESVSATMRHYLWLVVGLGWIVSAAVSAWWLHRKSPAVSSTLTDQLLREAQAEYLRGNWIDVELRLLKLLAASPQDVDARLMLASLYRHTRRLAEADAELRHLERFDSAVKWRWEIDDERRRLKQMDAERHQQDASPAASSDNETRTEEKIEIQASSVAA